MSQLPLTILIAALGGQGGGVLAGWIGRAARSEGLVVQATSTPGVSQRTGATSYYVEMVAPPAPALGLAPVPGRVDVLVCSELLEAARALERGMCTPARTVVVASTHRVYTTSEKMSGSDGRFESDRIVAAIHALARRAVLLDMESVRARHGAAISAVVFGALAGSGALPLSRGACEAAIREGGLGVTASLAAFADAFACAGAPGEAAPPRPISTVAEIVAVGAAQLTAYQDARYAQQFVARVERLARAAQGRGERAETAVREGARSLALWMAYDDAIAVAAAKSRASRLARIRQEAGAGQGDIVRVRDYLRPGIAEIAAILPARLGAWLERRGRRSGGPPGRSVTIETTSVTGALALRLVAALRPLRPRSLRYAREQADIENWLAVFEHALAGASQVTLLDLARLPRMRKGYGETHAAGQSGLARALEGYGRGRPVVWLDQR